MFGAWRQIEKPASISADMTIRGEPMDTNSLGEHFMASEYQKPIGSGFDRLSTARAVLEGIDLSGKKAIVTGGYSGIGVEATRALSEAGAMVTVPVRDRDKAVRELQGIENVTIADMDLGALASVEKFTADFRDENDQLDILMNNAGIMACPETRIGPDWEAQFATNHIGHFVLTSGLVPLLKKAGDRDGARVVSLSSTAHRRADIFWDDIHFKNGSYEKWNAYGQSKTANSLFAVELDRRLKRDGVRAFSVHPGGIVTPLQRYLEREEMVALGWLDKNGELAEAARALFKSAQAGAATGVWCATNPKLDGIGGVYCEDCDIAQLATPESMRFADVSPYAVDDASGNRLWDETEKMLTDK